MTPKPVWQGRKLIPKHELEESNFEEGEKQKTKKNHVKKISILREKRYYNRETQKGGYKDKNNPSKAKLAFEIKNRMADIKNSIEMLHDKIEKIF